MLVILLLSILRETLTLTLEMWLKGHFLYRKEQYQIFFISPVKKSRPCNYVDEDGEIVYDFICFVEARL